MTASLCCINNLHRPSSLCHAAFYGRRSNLGTVTSGYLISMSSANALVGRLLETGLLASISSKMTDHCSLCAFVSARFHECFTVVYANTRPVTYKYGCQGSGLDGLEEGAWCCSEIESSVCFCSAGYDVQSASTPDGVLYIAGAPRYNHTGRVVVYRLNKKNKIVVSQILKGEQVGRPSGVELA